MAESAYDVADMRQERLALVMIIAVDTVESQKIRDDFGSRKLKADGWRRKVDKVEPNRLIHK